MVMVTVVKREKGLLTVLHKYAILIASLSEIDRPEVPVPEDLSLTKREWETQLRIFRRKLEQLDVLSTHTATLTCIAEHCNKELHISGDGSIHLDLWMYYIRRLNQHVTAFNPSDDSITRKQWLNQLRDLSDLLTDLRMQWAFRFQ